MNYSAIRDGRDLMAWAEPNGHLVDARSIEVIVRDTLAKPVATEQAIGVPLLFSAHPDHDPVPMVTALVTDVLSAWRVRWCASPHCREPLGTVSWQLVIPCGASAVVIPFCHRHRRALDERIGPITWN